MQKAINFNVSIVSVKRNDCKVHFFHINKDDAMSITKTLLNEKKGIIIIFFSLYIKMIETIYYQRNRETMVKREKDYYQNKKEVLRKRAENKYRIIVRR